VEKNKAKISAEVEEILERFENADLESNPLSVLPKQQLKKALKFLEEYSEEKL
jgi:hypothetical protein